MESPLINIIERLQGELEHFVWKRKMQAIAEPQWMLDRMDSGWLYWRRNHEGSRNSRVKFRYDVEVKEFSKGEHELYEPEWTESSTNLTMGMTAIFCIMIVLLPWYIIGIN